MADSVQPVNVVINEQISPKIVTDIRAIGEAALAADKSIATLRASLVNLGAAQSSIATASAAHTTGMNNVTQATNAATHGTARFNTELLVLAHELSQGRYTRFAGSLMVLAQYGGVASAIFSGLGLTVLGLGAAIALTIQAVERGSAEFARINNILNVTNGYAGITNSEFKALADTLAHDTHTRLSEAESALEKVALTGRFTGDTLKYITGASLELGRRTGQDADIFITQFSKMSEGVTKFAIEYNTQFHTLTAAQIDYIRQLEKMGEREKAEQLVSKEIYDGIRANGEANLGILVRAWHSLTEAIDGAYEALKRVGRENTLEERITALQAREIALQADTRHPGAGLAEQQRLNAVQQQIQYLKDELELRHENAVGQAAIVKEQQAGIDASKQIADHWERFEKGTDRANREIKELEANLKLALKVNPNDTAALSIQNNLAAVEAQIRKRYDPQGVAEDKLADRQAAALAKVNRQLEDELRNVTQLSPNRLQQQEYDRIEEALLAKKIDLKTRDAERSAINAKLDAIYEGKRAEQVREVVDASALEQKYFTMNNREREIAIQLERLQQANIASGKGEFSPQQLDAMKAALEIRRRIKELEQIKDAAPLKARGEVNSIATQVLEQNLYLNNLKDMYAQIDEMRKADVLSEEQAEQAKGMVDAKYLEERLSGASKFFGVLSGLQNSESKKAQAIGKAAAIAQATIDGIVAVNAALKGPPGPPWSFAIAAATGAVVAANVAQIAGIKFAAGGLVRGPGTGTSDSISARLSDHEFVVNAQATRRFLPLLHAINENRYSGGGLVGKPNGYSGIMPTAASGGMNVSIHNYSGARVSVKQLTANDVAIMIRDQAPDVIASDIGRPNSRVSKSLASNLQAGRRLG